jgi:hypothetical protein
MWILRASTHGATKWLGQLLVIPVSLPKTSKISRLTSAWLSAPCPALSYTRQIDVPSMQVVCWYVWSDPVYPFRQRKSHPRNMVQRRVGESPGERLQNSTSARSMAFSWIFRPIIQRVTFLKLIWWDNVLMSMSTPFFCNSFNITSIAAKQQMNTTTETFY